MTHRLPIRVRLTIIYGGLFLLAGAVLLGLTYLLLERVLPLGVYATEPSSIRYTNGPTDLTSARGTPITDPVEIDGVVVAVSDLPAHLRSAALGSLITQGAIALAVVTAGAFAVGWLLAGRALEPLHRITETARRIATAPAADRGLHERIRLPGPRDEVTELAETFNTMLQRLDQAFDGQRRFVANASHELRTPLTLNRSLIEVAMRRRSASADVRQLGEMLLEINRRHERLIDGLLVLARSGHELTTRSYVDLADVVEHVVRQASVEASAAGVTIRPPMAGEAPVLGDAVLLERLVQNLVENGIRHNEPPGSDGWVEIEVGLRGANAVLAVTNTGPVIPAYEVAGLFEPFRRLDTTRIAGAGGAGLGLSIVRSIARAHGGDVIAVPRDGGGLTVTVTLPGADTNESARMD
jgi:signal transduction histidine kinase